MAIPTLVVSLSPSVGEKEERINWRIFKDHGKDMAGGLQKIVTEETSNLWEDCGRLYVTLLTHLC